MTFSPLSPKCAAAAKRRESLECTCVKPRLLGVSLERVLKPRLGRGHLSLESRLQAVLAPGRLKTGLQTGKPGPPTKIGSCGFFAVPTTRRLPLLNGRHVQSCNRDTGIIVEPHDHARPLGIGVGMIGTGNGISPPAAGNNGEWLERGCS